MRSSIVSTILGLIILFISLIILPIYFVSIINWRDDMNTAQTAARNFVDMVIDNGQITDKALSDLNLSLAGCTGTFTYEYFKEEKVTNPSVARDSFGNVITDEYGNKKASTETTWNYVEVTPETTWREGDLITIEIHQSGMNLFQRLAATMMGTYFTKVDVRLTGMVR